MAVEPEIGTAAGPETGDRTGAPETGTCGTGWPCWTVSSGWSSSAGDGTSHGPGGPPSP
ncbi:hypothetical protein OHA72_08590 [Dactylosporangium sp. NBC_01737]|uniref:hypothetical protein n=1 Tax=Dactylosporangium sp. NBC_01737 TaxID=2975959 RepID=UPI002E0D7E11|nr:hypothetical protein OHA72_08590 [Dactylosporangium sp. NBC_01737]